MVMPMPNPVTDSAKLWRYYYQTALQSILLKKPTLHKGLGCEVMELLQHDPTEIIRSGENLRFYDEETGIERIALAPQS